MAEQVRTWQEFVNSFTSGSDATIEILADLEVNDQPPTGDIGPNRNLTINGNNHKINNLQVAGTLSNGLFNIGNRDLTWNDVQFTNIDVASSKPVFKSGYAINFNRCTLQGQGSGKLCEIGNTNHAKFYRSAVYWKTVTAINNAFSDIHLDYSWGHFECPRATSSTSGIDFYRLDSSYLEGIINGHDGSVTQGGALADYAENSVLNIDSSLTRLSLVNNLPSVCTVYNTTKILGYSGDSGNLKGVTDAQMKSATALANVGFNIIP